MQVCTRCHKENGFLAVVESCLGCRVVEREREIENVTPPLSGVRAVRETLILSVLSFHCCKSPLDLCREGQASLA